VSKGKLVLLVLAVGMVALVASWRLIVTEERFELPSDFHGWVNIEVDNPNCPPLKKKDGALLFEVGDDGTACTSGKPAEGWFKPHFFYRDAQHTELTHDNRNPSNRTVRMLSGIGNREGVGIRSCRFVEFFVGSEASMQWEPRRDACAKQP
jgi:hypothetical protein